MAEPNEKKKILVPTRTPGKKTPGTFDNIRQLPQPHPVEEILGLPVERISTNEKVDIPVSPVDILISTPAPNVDIKISETESADIHPERSLDIRKKDRHSKSRLGRFIRLSHAIAKRIDEFCVKSELDKQDFHELAAIHYIEHVDIQKGESVDILISHDERRLMMWKTIPSIINLYLQYLPDNRWKARDDREGERFNDADLRIVEIGLLQALLRTEQKKIHSFRYFCDEIELTASVPLDNETLNLMLKRRREQYQAKAGQS
jgi:hypothetical protein